jgi:hypothetical protein
LARLGSSLLAGRGMPLTIGEALTERVQQLHRDDALALDGHC